MTDKSKVDIHFREAIESIDTMFGEGYAMKNPSLVGVFLQAGVAKELQETIEELRETVGSMGQEIIYALDSDVANQIQGLGWEVGKGAERIANALRTDGEETHSYHG